MEKFILYFKERYRENKIKIENDNIIVYHEDKVKLEKEIKLDDYIWNPSSKEEYANIKEYIKYLFNVDYGYCPQYLKNKIKTCKVTYFKECDKYVLDTLQNELEKNWKAYTSLYKDKELIDKFINFGKKIYHKIKINQEFLDLFSSCKYKKCYPEFISLLKNINMDKLDEDINKLVMEVGVPIPISCTTEGKVYSYWNDIIYFSTMMYIVKKEKAEETKFNILNYFKQLMKKVNYQKSYSTIISLYKDTKKAEIVSDIISYIFYYMDNHYGVYANAIEFWEADHLVDILEEHREYLMKRTESSINKKRYATLPLKKLQKSYDRRILSY